MSSKTILYVEDNEMNRKIVRDLLKRTKYQLVEALTHTTPILAPLTASRSAATFPLSVAWPLTQ